MKSKTSFNLWPVLGCVLALTGVVALSWLWTRPPQAALAQGPGDGGIGTQATVGTAFTYQGWLTQNGNPVSDTCDFQFSLYDAETGGNPVGSTQTKTGVSVSDGYLTVPDLDFGADIFTGEARWLAIAVKCSGDSSYVSLSGRVALNAAPYALALPGLWTQQNATSPNVIGGYSGNQVPAGVSGAVIAGGGSSGFSNQVTGDYGTVGGGGANTVSSTAATVSGGGNNTASDWYAAVGGGYGNTAGGYAATVGGGYLNHAASVTSTIGGGEHISVTGKAATVAGGSYITVTGDYAAVGGGQFNTASGDAATVGGGYVNTASGEYATIAGGVDNTASGLYATVGGGRGNTASNWGTTVSGGYYNTASGKHATVGGGYYNIASNWDATVGGGTGNTASGDTATVGGGTANTVTGNYATVGGGTDNLITATYGTIAGGYINTVTGNYATIPGGSDNVAQGDYSFAAGRKARAYNKGCFVLTDATDAYEDCINDNRFVFRVTNALYIWTTASHTAGTVLPTGGTSWSSLSDRNVKENFAPVDQARLLEALAAMPVQTWNLKAQSPEIRHVGPVAQDFNAAFGYLFDEVESPVRINNMDAVGVALAAAQGLYAQNQAQTARIEALEAENAALREENAAQQAQIDDLAARLAALEAAGPARPDREK